MGNTNIMNKDELHEYGINLITNYLEKNDYTIMEKNLELDSVPQLVVQKGTDMSFVIVETYMYPKKNIKIDKDKLTYMKQVADGYNAKCFVARVGLAWAGAMNGKELGMAYKNSDF
ncbi:MAG: hypothetical protein MJ245_05530, partial [Clostridia bacterium]|nr:hypothetical protein [Clostridia bacterium]